MNTALALVKPRYHVSFATVVVAALLFADPIDVSLCWRLAALFLSFNVLLYSGIYIFNDIADRTADARHPIKRMRPIASRRLRVAAAAALATILCAAATAFAAIFFPPPILGCYAAIVALNAAYSGGGRDTRFLDIALNSAPHAVRFLMGTLLAGRVPPPGHLAAWCCLAVGVSCVRRLVEKEAGGEPARPVLKHYSTAGLALAADLGVLVVVMLWVLDAGTSPGFYALVMPAYLLLVVAARRVPAAQFGFARLWLR